MGGVVKSVGGFLGLNDTDVDTSAANPGLQNNAKLDWDLGNQVAGRANQNYAAFLYNQTNGMQPSIAQNQLKVATDQAIANQMAMAASQRGASAGTTQRLAMQQAAGLNQSMAQQNGLLAAQEAQQNAQNALQYQGLNDQFSNHLYELGNQRDLGLMGSEVQGGLGAAQIHQGDSKRRGDFVQSMFKNGASAFATGGAV
jgi:hypothetical protein